MILTITSALAFFCLIALSAVVFFVAKRFSLPYTVLLVLVGILLVPIVSLPYLRDVFGFLADMALTPELLFFIFLPVLIFESGFNMNIRKILDSAWVISALSVISLLISTVCIAAAIYYILPLIGIHVPFIVALIFGALISPTDPVAALSIFKECGVPRRLANIFEGESLLNDGTAMALFLVVLGVATNGFHGTETVIHGVLQFAMMVVFGVGFGLIMAAVFSRTLKYTKSNEFVTVTLMLISAHLVFILAEVINKTELIHVSPIIATAVAALFMGNYARHVLAPRVDEYLSKLIEHMAFISNSLVFLMAGLLFAGSKVNFTELWVPILLTVLIVAVARVVCVYAVTLPLNACKLERPVPAAWQKLLAWGSMRGALSIIIVMLIPADFTVPGWTYHHTPRDFLLALTIGCILATLFIKAPLIKPIMRKLNIRDNSPLAEAHEADLGVYFLLNEKTQIQGYKTKGFLSQKQHDSIVCQIEKKLSEAEAHRKELVSKHGIRIFQQSLHLAMVRIEIATLKRLFINDEVSEKTFRRIYSKLGGRLNRIEESEGSDLHVYSYTDHKDVFEHLVNLVQMPFDRERELSHQQRLEYYRAQKIIARKAVHTIERMQTENGSNVFLQDVFDKVVELYRRYKDRSGAKADEIVAAYPDELAPYMEKLAWRTLAASSTRAMGHLGSSGLADEHAQEVIHSRYSF